MHRDITNMDFRTPQHPKLGTNNWGGASPLLARNIATESLETKYLRLINIHSKEEGKHTALDEVMPPLPPPPQLKSFNRGSRQRHCLFWRRLRRDTGGAGAVLGSKKRSRWLPGGDYRTRWPQGWC